MEQQAWILRSFLQRQEAVDEAALDGFAEEFARLKSQSNKYRTDKTFSTKSAEKQENIKRNRYKDIVPFDHSRVKLTLTTSKNDTDYINASFIQGVSGSRAYIATQGPLPNTVLDFFRMLWEYNVQVVVMACREFEMGKKKSERYWPEKQEQPFVCEPFTVFCDSEENKGDYVTRMLRVTFHNCSRTLKQLHYVNWPDHGIPDAIPPILDLLHEMRSYQAHNDVPVCIHCSAGCGRTGALCAIDYTWNLLKGQMITPEFSIYDLVQNMRTQRPSVVQTKEQYELVYRTIKLVFQRYLQSVDEQACDDQVTSVQCAVTPDTDSALLDQGPVLLLQQQLVEETAVVSHHPAPSPFVPDNLITTATQDKEMDQRPWHAHRAFPDTVVTSQDLQEGSRTSPNHRAPAIESTNKRDDVPSTICLMVEDPYFDTPISSPASDQGQADTTGDTGQWTASPVINAQTSTPQLISPVSDDETPPPLPERTPESYLLAVDTEHKDSSERLSVVIPPNAAAEAVRVLGGRPPSPAPPLPERTLESYQLDIDPASMEQNLEVTPAVDLNRIGTSSEWSGSSSSAASASQTKTREWVRSKSLRAKLTLSVPVTPVHLPFNTTAHFHPAYPPVDPPTPQLPSRPEDGPTPSLPDRTLDSFIPNTVQTQGKTDICLQPNEATPRVGMSSEWDENAHPRKFLDVVLSRSKSIRAKTPKQEPLAGVWQLAPPAVVTTGTGSDQAVHHDGNCPRSLSADTAGNRSNEKGMSRTKSLKFFRNKPKPTIAPPLPPNQPGTPPPTSSSVFKFGFGNRFGKPKGPRSYPKAWT